MKLYKMYQELYNRIVTDHTDRIDENVEILVSDELVDNAITYFTKATFPLIYPAKSYGAAIVYATLIEKIYGYPLRETLNDPDLFQGQDPYFKPYSTDPETYESIIKRLLDIPNWLESGWVPQTCKYFFLECTEEGINKVNESLMGV